MRLAILLACIVSLPLRAQVVETPVPFDSAGKIRVLTPPLVSRFSLAPPPWPVTGDFSEARLYTSSGGGTVLVVVRRNGVVERYASPLLDAAALQASVDAALTRTGAFVAEDAGENVRRAFARNQMILGALLYGPGMAALANDGKTGTVLYLLGAGGTFFAVSALSRNMHVTRAQNHLSTDGALRGFAIANALLYATAGDFPDRKTVSGVGLAGAVLGSIGGFHRGRRLSDAEAHASTSASTLAALTTFGLLGTVDALESRSSERGVAAALVATGVGGYFAGPAYPRRSRFTITAGDVKILWVGATLGAAAALTPFVDADPEPNVVYAVGTAGLLAGTALTHSTWVRSYDHTMGDVFQTWLGTIAGGLLGGALVIVAEPEEGAVASGLVTAGAIVGAIASHALARPASGTMRRRTALGEPRRGRIGVDIAPVNAVLAVAGVRGAHPLLSLRF